MKLKESKGEIFLAFALVYAFSGKMFSLGELVLLAWVWDLPKIRSGGSIYMER